MSAQASDSLFTVVSSLAIRSELTIIGPMNTRASIIGVVIGLALCSPDARVRAQQDTAGVEVLQVRPNFYTDCAARSVMSACRPGRMASSS